MPAKKHRGADYQSSLFTDREQLPVDMAALAEKHPAEPMARVAQARPESDAPSYVSWAELDRIIRATYIRYDYALNRTGIRSWSERFTNAKGRKAR